MLPIVVWALVALLAFLLMFGFWFAVYSVRTAYIVVHPWDMGFSEEEISEQLRSLDQLPGVRCDKKSCWKRYAEYCARLAQVLRWCYVRNVVLVDYERHEKQSHSGLLQFLPWIPGRRIRMVKTKDGRPELLGESWEAVAAELWDQGVRDIVIVGCFYGVKDGKPVNASAVPFCVNYTLWQLLELDCFDNVEVKTSGCFIEEVEGTGGVVPFVASTLTTPVGREKGRRLKEKRKKTKKRK